MNCIYLTHGYADGHYVLPPLPYELSELEPFVSEKTLLLHHDKHHAGYVAGANAAAATVKAGVEGGKAVAEIAAGTAAGGPWGAILSAAWSLRHTLYKVLINEVHKKIYHTCYLRSDSISVAALFLFCWICTI